MLDLKNAGLTELLHDFYTLTGLKLCIFDTDFEECASTPIKLYPFCARMRENPEFERRCHSCDAAHMQICRRTRKPLLYRCHAGLTEYLAPLYYEGVIVAFICIGMMTDGTQKEFESIAAYTAQFGISEQTCRELYDKHRHYTPANIKAACSILDACISHIYHQRMLEVRSLDTAQQIEKYINDNIAWDLSIEHLCAHFSISRAELYQLFQKLEFVRLIDKYGLRGAAADAPKTEQKVQSIPRREEMPADVDSCAVYLAEDGSVGLAWAEGVCALTPMEAQMGQLSLAGKNLIFHDSKTAMHRLDELGIQAGECVFDTALAAYDLNPSSSDYTASKLATNYLGLSVEDADAAACAEAVWHLRPVLSGELEKNGMERLYREIEFPLCRVLYRMENRGICIDREQLRQFGDMLSRRISDCETLIFSYSGGEFNINSTRQLGELLFEKLGLPPVKKTKTGYSTNAEVLEKLKNKHPIIPAIMDYRMLTKLKSTYADGLMKEIREDGRIHTTFQNLVTATGRLSSTEPNLQNIPVRTDLGAEIRKMFIPKPGCVLVDADYSQIELRVLAHIAGDDAMRKAFCDHVDIHTATAAQVFGVPVEEVTPLQRRHAKAVNFGIVYGISEFSLAEDIGVSRYEARAYIDNYLNNYRGVKEYMHKVVADAREIG